MRKNSKHKLESIEKMSKSRISKSASIETKKKMSEAHKGNTNGFKKGRSSWNKNKNLSLEHKNNLSLAHKDKKFTEQHKKNIKKALTGRIIWWKDKISKALQGDKNPTWQGGKSFESYSIEFNRALKNKIRKRDNYTCQLTGKTEKELGRKLTIHHIDYDKMNCKEDNLISLSNDSNSKVNFNREDWTKYFKNILKKNEHP
jgi:hypothetical protein